MVADVDARRRRPRSDADARGSLAVACWTPSHPALVTHEDPRVEPCLIPCGPSWSLSRLPAGPVLRSPLLVRLEMAFICMHDTPRNATFSAFLKISAGLILVASQSSATTCIHISFQRHDTGLKAPPALGGSTMVARPTQMANLCSKLNCASLPRPQGRAGALNLGDDSGRYEDLITTESTEITERRIRRRETRPSRMRSTSASRPRGSSALGSEWICL